MKVLQLKEELYLTLQMIHILIVLCFSHVHLIILLRQMKYFIDMFLLYDLNLNTRQQSGKNH